MDLKYHEEVGSGTYGRVWRATDSEGQQLAVKFFSDTTPSLADQAAIDHARALMRVDCPSVVRVHSVERQRHPESGKPQQAIIMDYIEGPLLHDLDERLTAEHARAVIRDICAALEAIHAAALHHGDLHDKNVIVTTGGATVFDIRYTHSLADVGSRTAALSREQELRNLSVVLRKVVEQTGIQSSSVAEAYYRAQGATSVRAVNEPFAELLAPVHTPIAPSPTMQETFVDRMTEPDFASLLASVDDSQSHHILWVTKQGEVRISDPGTYTPAGFQDAHESELQFRWETFGRGNGYCGPEAAQDARYVAEKFAELQQDWRERKTGYVDY